MNIPRTNVDSPNEIKKYNLEQHGAKGKTATQADRILVALAESEIPLTRSQLAKALNMPVSSVCGRVHTLFSDLLVDIVGTVTCPITKSTAHALECSDSGKEAAKAAAERVAFSDRNKAA